MRKVFVYGTLKRGYYWHRLIKHCEYLETIIVKGYKIVRFPNMNDKFYVPVMITSNPDDEVLGEVFNVDGYTFEQLLDLEKGYSCIKVTEDTYAFVADEKATIYETALSLPEITKIGGVYNYANT